MSQWQFDSSNRSLVAGAIVLTTILFTALQVQQSMFQGQLSWPITYDDIVYFVDALHRLHRVYDQGLSRLVWDWLENPPHSPTSTFTGFLGFAIFGRRDWAPAVTNSIYLIALLTFLAYVTAHLRWISRIMIAAIVLTCPLAGHLIIESRPDILCGIATACASFLLLKNSRSEARRKEQFLTSTMAGLAFLAKPSISPITATILLSTLFAVAVRDGGFFHPQADSKLRKLPSLSKILAILQVLRQYTPFVALTLLICLPHYLIARKQIFDYIHLTVFGAYKEIWQTNYPFAEQVLYYISGPGGKMMFGAWGIIALFVALVALAIAILTQDWQSLWRTFPYLAIISVAYLLVTIPSTKSPFLGMAFGSLILWSTVYLLIHLAQVLESRSIGRVYRTLGQVACIVAILVSLSLFQWPWFNKTSLPRAGLVSQPAYEHALLHTILQRLEERLARATTQCAPQIALTAESAYLNNWTVEYELLKQGIDHFTTVPLLLSGEFKAYWQYIRQSNYVIAFSLDNPTTIPELPPSSIQARLLERLNTAQRFKLIDTFDRPESLGSGKVFLYRAAQRCKPLPDNPLIK